MSASDFGLKISLPGYDVATATPEQCAVHSSYPPLKAKVGQSKPHIATVKVNFTATVTQSVTHTLYSIPHGYGYVPLTISNLSFDDGASTQIRGIGYTGVGVTLEIRAYCDATNFYITLYDNFNWTSSASTLDVSYTIFAENGS